MMLNGGEHVILLLFNMRNAKLNMTEFSLFGAYLSNQLTLPHYGKFIQFYDFIYLYNFIKEIICSADFIT